MKNKKFILGLTFLVAGTLLFTNCKKESPKVPEPDKDFGSSSDAALALYILSDINEICAQSGDGGANVPDYDGIINRDTVAKIVTVTYNNLKGPDGKVRDGVLKYSFGPSTLGAKYYRQPGYKATVEAINFSVDGYSVIINSMDISNSTTNGFNPAVTNLTWVQNLNMEIWKPNGENKITANGSLTKTLINTNPATAGTGTMVPYTNINTAIKWQFAKITNHGTIQGESSDLRKYKAVVEKETALKRDLSCAPDVLLFPRKHPIIKGMVTLDVDPDNANLTTKKHMRYIDYDPFKNETCDYNTSITINGISYSMDMNQ